MSASVALWVAFAVAAAAGAVLRSVIDRALTPAVPGAFPRGTLVVNLLGSLALGLLVGGAAPTNALFVAGTGFCGAFTTFSTFCFETVVLLQDGRRAVALRNVAVTVAGCLAAAAAGIALTWG
jgi:CrcB protein